jgi:SAM-dependent methyltransferase
VEAQRRWRALVRARRAETERLLGAPLDASFWDARARRFAAQRLAAPDKDPLLARIRRATRKDGTVLDVGSGPGRFALALAPRVGEVVAVDPSPAMLAILRREARRRGLGNVRCVNTRWEDAEVEPADVVICSYVLPLIEDGGGFLRRLDAATRGRAFVYLNAASFDLLLDPLWRHFHGRPRHPAPTYLDAVAVLRELGIDPDVEVVEVPSSARFRDLERAVASYRDQLLLPGTAAVRRELRSLLAPWLVRREDGLASPVRTLPAAIVSWTRRR